MKPKKLFVGNCDYNITEDALKEFFETNGFPVTSSIASSNRISQKSHNCRNVRRGSATNCS